MERFIAEGSSIENDRQLEDVKRGIAYHSVSFAYEGGEPILKNFVFCGGLQALSYPRRERVRQDNGCQSVASLLRCDGRQYRDRRRTDHRVWQHLRLHDRRAAGGGSIPRYASEQSLNVLGHFRQEADRSAERARAFEVCKHGSAR